MKRIAPLLLLTLGSASFCLADLDEQGFDKYQEGDLLGQKEWRPQSPGPKGYANTAGRAFIKFDPATGNRFLAWNAGFGPTEQTRAVKVFPATEGPKVAARFDLAPGSATVPGQFAFEQGRVAAFSLRFVKGTLRAGGAGTVEDTQAAFEPHEWNAVELQFDFDLHRVEVFLNGKPAGAFNLPEAMTGLDKINFFGGGDNFETALDNLSIRSTDAFTPPEPKP